MSKLVLERLSAQFGERILETSDFRGDEVARIAPESWLEVAQFLKGECGMNQFTDMTAVDYPEREPEEPRFDVVLCVRSLGAGQRERIKTRVPLAISGALTFTFLDLTTLNIYSQVGLITLVGLIAKNGILIVEFANTLQARGLDKLAALREASRTRLRPVLMTSAATVFGHFPLVLVSGPGAEARNSIGIVLVTGMVVGTLFTLFVVPVFYSFIAADHRRRTEDEEEIESKPAAHTGNVTPVPA